MIFDSNLVEWHPARLKMIQVYLRNMIQVTIALWIYLLWTKFRTAFFLGFLSLTVNPWKEEHRNIAAGQGGGRKKSTSSSSIHGLHKSIELTFFCTASQASVTRLSSLYNFTETTSSSCIFWSTSLRNMYPRIPPTSIVMKIISKMMKNMMSIHFISRYAPVYVWGEE